MEQDTKILLLPHVLSLLFVCGKTWKNKFNQSSEKMQKQKKQSNKTNISL